MVHEDVDGNSNGDGKAESRGSLLVSSTARSGSREVVVVEEEEVGGRESEEVNEAESEGAASLRREVECVQGARSGAACLSGRGKKISRWLTFERRLSCQSC